MVAFCTDLDTEKKHERHPAPPRMPRRTRNGNDGGGSPPHELTFEEERALRAAARLAREAERGDDLPGQDVAPEVQVLNAAPVDDSATELVDAADLGHASSVGSGGDDGGDGDPDATDVEDDPDATQVDPPPPAAVDGVEEEAAEEALHDEVMVEGRTAQEEDQAEMREAERVVEEAPAPRAAAAAPVAAEAPAAAKKKRTARRSHPLPGIAGKGGKHGAKRHRKVQHAASTLPPSSLPCHALTPPSFVCCRSSAITSRAVSSTRSRPTLSTRLTCSVCLQ